MASFGSAAQAHGSPSQLSESGRSAAAGGGHLDLSSLEELDPSVADGYRVIYDREVPVECRTRSGSEDARQGVLESIKVKMLMLGGEEAPSSIRIELSSEADLFFHYMHVIDTQAFSGVQSAQKLMIQFEDYHNVLTRMLNACIREPHIHLAIFTMTVGTAEGRLDFIQNMEYKFVELMSCAFERSPEEVTQQHISFRYNSIKQKLALTQAKLFEVTNLVKTKNPSLLLQIQKSSNNGGGSSGGSGGGGGGGGGKHGVSALDLSAISHYSDTRRR